MNSKFALFMTTYNGEKYIADQIKTIILQKKVNLDIYIYDDHSTDSTISIIKSFNLNNLKTIKINPKRLGSAGLNFFSMIMEIDFSKYDYICFSDQDDIWKENKLYEGLKKISKSKCFGYSSNLINISKTGSLNKLIKKKINSTHGHIFECISNGNTFILNCQKLLEFKFFWINNFNKKKYKHLSHEWVIFVYFVEKKYSWYHDNESFIFYRQHDHNVLGSRSGFFNKLIRLKLLLNGWYWDEVKLNLQIYCKLRNIDDLNLKKLLIKNFYGLRRNFFESIIIFIYLFFKSF